MSQPIPPEPHEGITADAAPETEAAERDQTSYVARGGGSGGYIPDDPQPADEQTTQIPTGTAAGDALAGVTVDADDREDAVSGDTGPEHPGQRS